jgi:hypothetical protein
LLAGGGPARAAEYERGPARIDFNGYLKDLAAVSDSHGMYEDLGLLDDRWLVDNYQRLRLRTQLSLTDHFAAIAHWEGFIAVGDSVLAQQRAEELAAQAAALPPSMRPDAGSAALVGLLAPPSPPRFMDMEEQFSFDGGERLAHDIDRLLLRGSGGGFELETGRMALSWGSGRVWNPTDLWSPFAATEIDKEEKRGVDLVHATAAFPGVVTIEGVWAPLSVRHHYQIEPDDSSAAGRARIHVGEYDIAGMGGFFAGDTVVGADFSGYVGGAGLRGEAAYTFVDPEMHDRDYLRAVLSADYGFAVAWNPYLLAEAYFNGFGEADPDRCLDRLSDPSVQRQIQLGRPVNLGRDYLTLLARIQPHPLFTLSLQPLVNLDDASAFIAFVTEISAAEGVDLNVGANVFAGPENTEFGGMRLSVLNTVVRSPDQYFLYLKAYF